jgi:hypothetical protein
MDEQRTRGWSQRYAGWEPDLHQGDKILGPKKGMTLRSLIDSVAEDARLDRRPLKPVKRAIGVRA